MRALGTQPPTCLLINVALSSGCGPRFRPLLAPAAHRLAATPVISLPGASGSYR